MKTNNTPETAEPIPPSPPDLSKTVQKVRDLLDKENSFLSVAVKNRHEATMIAFDIGEIIENEVIGNYGDKRMQEFANLCGFSSLKTAYNYLYLFRAGISKAVLAIHADLPRTYWYALGSSIKWDSDMMGDMLRRNLLQYPLWKDTEQGMPIDLDHPETKDVADTAKLTEVCKALKDLRNELKQAGILYAFQEYALYLGKPPKKQDELEEWLNNEKDNLCYSHMPEEVDREVITFITERMPNGDGGWVDISYILIIDKDDLPKYDAALERIVKFQIAVAAITGWNSFKMDIGEKTQQINDEFRITPPKDDIDTNDRNNTNDASSEGNSSRSKSRKTIKTKDYKAIKWGMQKKEKLSQVRKQSPNTESIELAAKLVHGDCIATLTSDAYSKRSIDCCLTDPPYGKEVYYEWRKHTKVYHDEPKTTREAAELLGSVAKQLVDRELIKEQFIWFSFCPIDWVHLFLPPVLEAFKGQDIKHQVLVWDKVGTGKAGGYRTFARQAEAIIYVNVGNRALFPVTKDGNEVNLHTSIFTYMAERKDGANEFWKPIPLLEHLIGLATGEDDDADSNRQLILDPFCGSGSTGVAAIKCKRDFRLIESHKGQFDMAVDNVTLEAGAK